MLRINNREWISRAYNHAMNLLKLILHVRMFITITINRELQSTAIAFYTMNVAQFILQRCFSDLPERIREFLTERANVLLGSFLVA